MVTGPISGASTLPQDLGSGQRREWRQYLKALPSATKWRERWYPDFKRIGRKLYVLMAFFIYRCRRLGGAVCVT